MTLSINTPCSQGDQDEERYKQESQSRFPNPTCRQKLRTMAVENTSRDVVFFGYHHRLVSMYHDWGRSEGNLILIVR